MGTAVRRVTLGVLWGAAAGTLCAAVFCVYWTADALTSRQQFPRHSKFDIVPGWAVFLVAGGLVGGWSALWRANAAGRSPVRRAVRWVVVSSIIAGLVWTGYCAFSPACRYAVYGLFNGEPRHDGLCRSFWVQELKSNDDYRRRNALWALEKMGPEAAPAVPAVRPLLNDSDNSVRRAAAKVLQHASVGDPETIAALQPLLDVPEGELRANARDTLFKFVLRDQREPLTAALDHRDYDVQRAAAAALGRMGREAIPAVPKLLSRWSIDGFFNEVRNALSAIGRAAPAEFTTHVRDYLRRFRPEPGQLPGGTFRMAVAVMQDAELPVVPLLVELLADPEEAVRLNAAECLAGMGAKAKSAKPALEKLGNDPSEPVRRMADNARHRIETDVPSPTVGPSRNPPPLSLNDLKTLLQSDDPKARAEACEWVHIWASGSSAVELLTPLLRDADGTVRRTAQRELVPMMAGSDAALALVIERLPLPEWGPKAYAAEELGKLGDRARPGVPALVRLLNDDSQAQAAIALWRIEGTDNEAVMRVVRARGSLIFELAKLRPPPLRTIAAGLESDDPSVRKDTARALADLGPDAREYVPTLLKQMPEDWSDRDAYAELIGRIEPGAGARAVSWMRWKAYLSEAALIGLSLGVAFLILRWIAATCWRAFGPAPRRYGTPKPTPFPSDNSGDAR